MACNCKASVLLIMALVFIVSSGGHGGAGVKAWCITVHPNPGPNPYVCNIKNGPEICDAQCKEVNFRGGLCDGINGCACLSCGN